jgi:guanylate kinase
MRKKGKLYIISAPSGTGKSTVIRCLMKLRKNLFFSVSATTRRPRPEERDGREYHFISREQFEDMIGHNEFLEYAEYVGNYYGTPIQPIRDHIEKGFDVILDIDVQGHRQIIEKMPEAVSVFLAPPSLEELENRLRKRGRTVKRRSGSV